MSYIHLLMQLLMAGIGLWLPLLCLVKLQSAVLFHLPRSIWMPFALTGVPVHELSHAIACVLTGHKINRIEFFKPDNSGTLGFVEHSFRPGILSWFSNLFIGVAPLIGGAATISGLTYLLTPELLDISTHAMARYDETWLSMWLIVSESFTRIGSLDWTQGVTWLWLYLSISIAMFMVPSKTDFQGASKGILVVLIALLLLASVTTTAAFRAIDSLVFCIFPLYPLWLTSLCVFLLFFVVGKILSRKTS